MKPSTAWLLCSLGVTGLAFGQGTVVTNLPPVISYTLLDGSEYLDDCLICDRLSIPQPLRGTFDLVLQQNTPPYTFYTVSNVDFTASPGFSGEAHLSGEGSFTRFEEFAVQQRMDLTLQVSDALTNQLAFLTNTTDHVQVPFPMIRISLMQTNGTPIHTCSLSLNAAPIREVWFSLTQSLTFTNGSNAPNEISPGDLISSVGRLVRRNSDLVARLGIMPSVPDLGLDAAQVTRGGEILFSVARDEFSETLGPIQHGDLLSDRGRIVKRNQDLLAAFGVSASSPDAGLDAMQVMPDGEILFSIQSDVKVNDSRTLSSGDVLTDQGKIWMTNGALLANFQPAVTNQNFGLDVLEILPTGEIWFSVEKGFTDSRLGPVQPGDLLSSRGYRMFSNKELVAAFGPKDPSLDYGLNAVFVVTDTQPPAAPPRLLAPIASLGSVHFEGDGEGNVFQLESAPSPIGPWTPRSPIQPELSFDVPIASTPGAAEFFRVRQW